ncbi:hypothetical protein [Phaeacidiphilus oryzae]|uniref:hypothetical protein n=1 Tax=Phaeacidiphilus oryzae TaxID=348818 RepID=UPI00056A6C33|nr:hypothetical protein [Phaeacidiphilus oryzae]
MGLFAAKCPVGPEARAWIEKSMALLAGEFGPEPLTRAPVLPTAEFFPGPYAGSEADVRQVVARVCGYMGVAADRVEVEVEPDDGEDAMVAGLRLNRSSRSAAGHYRRQGGRAVVSVDGRLAARPTALVAVVAHELGHVLLIEERGLNPGQRDHEQLTDLLTVYFGLGVFNANAAFEFRQGGDGWSSARLGYLSEQMFGYALACYARLRGETGTPAWARHLDTNPRAYLKQGLRWMAAAGSSGGRGAPRRGPERP